MAAQGDIFSRGGNNYAGGFAADGARVVFSGEGSDLGMITSGTGFQYAQDIRRIYDLNNGDTFLIAGRARGGYNSENLLGPRRLSLAFYKKYGNVCNAGDNIMNFEAEANCVASENVVPTSNDGLFRFILANTVIQAISVGVRTEDMMINHATNGLYVSLQMPDNTD